MCKTCNNTGGIAYRTSWGIEFKPCPDNHCDFSRDDSDIERLQAWLDSLDRSKSA
ncbi:hypothetical protein GCM10008934_02770 [Virgibacillus salarius]